MLSMLCELISVFVRVLNRNNGGGNEGIHEGCQVQKRECMRFAVNAGGVWRMGCELVSPLDGRRRYTLDVLRNRTLTRQ